MNEYQRLREKLFSLVTVQPKLRLENMAQANAALNFPDKSFKSIHVAGTNGKGSVTTKIANALTYSGYKTGIYTSPHILSHRERIAIDGKYISKNDFAKILKELFKLQKKLDIYLSFFELSTLLAFLYFARKKVDFAVIETGLGGRLDATNIITPVLCVITTITFDHTDVLGKTIEEIAYEKAQIIKPDVPVVLGAKAQLKLVIDDARSKNTAVYYSKDEEGFYDVKNQQTAKTALEILSKKYPVKKQAVRRGLKTRPAGRFEVLTDLGPKAVIYDVAHNEDAFLELKKALGLFYPNEKFRLILGFSKHKDIRSCARIIITFASFIHIVSANNIKAVFQREIQKALVELNFSKYQIEKDTKRGVNLAKGSAQKNHEILLVCGSFYVVCEGKMYLQNLKTD